MHRCGPWLLGTRGQLVATAVPRLWISVSHLHANTHISWVSVPKLLVPPRCPGALYDAEYQGSLPIEVPQGRRRELQNETTYESMFQLRLALTAEDFDEQRGSLTQRLSSLYGVPVTLQLQAGSAVVDVTAKFSDMPSLTTFVEHTRTISDTTLSEVLAVDTSVLSALTITNQTVQVPIDSICPVGFYCSAAASYACPLGTWNNQTGQTDSSSCTPCPERTTTLEEGASSIHDCVCLASYYKAPDGECLACPVGSDCSDSGYTLSTMPVLVGYFRPSSESIDIRRCVDASENCNGRDACSDSSSGCRGNVSAPCAPTLDGVLCQLCEEEGHFYVRAKHDAMAHCEPCSQVSSSGWVSTLLVILCVMAAAIAVVVLSKRLPQRPREQLSQLWHSMTDLYGM